MFSGLSRGFSKNFEGFFYSVSPYTHNGVPCGDFPLTLPIIAEWGGLSSFIFKIFQKILRLGLTPYTRRRGFVLRFTSHCLHCPLSIAQRHANVKSLFCTNSGFFPSKNLLNLPIDKLLKRWYNGKIGAPQSLAHRQILVNTFFFVQNDEKLQSENWSFFARKRKEKRKVVGWGW